VQARRLAKEQSKMAVVEPQVAAAQRRDPRPSEGRKGALSESQKRCSRKERERLRKKAEAGDAMEVE